MPANSRGLYGKGLAPGNHNRPGGGGRAGKWPRNRAAWYSAPSTQYTVAHNRCPVLGTEYSVLGTPLPGGPREPLSHLIPVRIRDGTRSTTPLHFSGGGVSGVPAVQPFSFERIWGGARALYLRSRRTRWIDLLLLLAVVGLLLALVSLSREWTGRHEPAAEIDLSLWALPGYTLFSLSRGLIAYLISLGFTLVYGYWAARDPLAERVLVPLLDIFQSIPVLTFMPVFFMALKDLVPGTNVGLEL